MKVAIDVSCLSEPMTGIPVYTHHLAQQTLENRRKGLSFYYFFDLMHKQKRAGLPFSPQQVLYGGKARQYLFFSSKILDGYLNDLTFAKQLPIDLDLFHSTNYKIPEVLLKQRAKTKHLVTVYDLSFLLYPKFFADDSRSFFKAFKHSLHRADHFHTISESSKRDMIQHLSIPENKISVIYPGINTYENLPAHPSDSNILTKFSLQDYLLFVGTLEPRKNVTRLITSFAKVKKKYSSLKLILVGRKGWLYEPIFKEIDSLNLKNDVLYLGQVSQGELRHLYKNAKAFVYPSLYEGFGMPPLEAMAQGCPVVTSNTSSLPEAVGDAAILIDPENTESITHGILRLLNDSPLQLELRQKGIQQVSRYSWGECAEQMVKTYEKVLKCPESSQSIVRSRVNERKTGTSPKEEHFLSE